MNKRIKELAVQSMLVHEGEGNTLLTGWMSHVDLSEYIEKFAELIVRECAEVAGYYYTRNECVSPRQIKEHFGVEE